MMSKLEIAANVVTGISIFLASRNSVLTWSLGIIGCSLFAILFYQVQLFADVTLQIFFIGTSALGWYQWQYGNAGAPTTISSAELGTLFYIIPLGFLVASIYGLILYLFTQAFAPFLDSGILVFSVIAQVLMMRRQLHCWIFWLLVNSVAIPLYASRGLYLTAALYACYWINAWVAYRYWQRLIITQNPQAHT